MAMTVQQLRPVAQVPFVLGVLRRLEVAPILDRLLPPHPAHVLSCGRGVAALGRAMLDGDQALYKGGDGWQSGASCRCPVGRVNFESVLIVPWSTPVCWATRASM